MTTKLSLFALLTLIQYITGLPSYQQGVVKRKRHTLEASEIDNGISISTITHRLITNSLSNKNVKYQDMKFPVVDTSEGLIRGVASEWKSTQLYKFLGIPYVDRPERFKLAKPMKPWIGIRNATDGETKCFQKNKFTGEWGGSEDCLFLDIVTPTLEDKKLPVLIWIHGGMFKNGNGHLTTCGPQRLNKKGLVVVGINYRLGLFGFLNSGTADAPGNMGLKDCVMALRWIKKNIRRFGGDPDNITVYGISTGSMIVESLVLSPMTKGLINKAAMQSGSMLSSWSTHKNPIREVYRLAKAIGEDSSDLDVIMKKLIEIDGLQLLKMGDRLATDARIFSEVMPFVPSAEKLIPGEEPFFTEYPANIMKTGNFESVPLMVGFNSIEGLVFTKYNSKVFDLLKTYDRVLEEFIPPPLMDAIESSKRRREILQSARKLYFNDRPISNETILDLLNMVGDLLFACGSYSSVKIWQNVMKHPVYFMEFAHSDDFSKGTRTHFKHLKGAGHSEDKNYVFIVGANKSSELSNVTNTVIDRMVTLLANFARHGNPIPSKSSLLPITWPPISKNEMPCIKVSEKLELLYDPLKERCHFWNEINKQYLKPFHYE